MNRKISKKSGCYLLSIVFLLAVGACNPTKKLLPHEYLVDHVEVKNTKQASLPKENFEAFFRQKPNRKLFGKIHFYVWWYDLFNEEKIRQKKIRRSIKYDKINARRIAKNDRRNARRALKGKKPKVPKLKDKESSMLIENVRDIGEPPVVFDSLLTEQTRLQLSKYLFSKGFFNNHVTDTVQLSRSQRATVKYMLYPKKPYMINSIAYRMDDEMLGELILKDTANALIKAGTQYDAEKLLAEQQRLTDMAQNNGYFYFENAYINFDVDSSYNNHTVSVKVVLTKFAKPYSATNDSLIYINHPRYRIENVYIITEPVIGNVRDVRFNDTVRTRKPGTVFLVNKPLSYRRPLITANVDLYKDQVFRRDTAQQTYKQLLGLGIFRNVTIQFLKNPDYSSRLDCYIICNPLIRQSITTETEGTNTSGNLGIDGDIVYQNRNFFRGGELVELKLQGAIVAQQQFNNQGRSNGNLGNTFNTIQFGPELTFSVPRAFFPFSLIPFKKEMSPRTYVKTSINYQSRPEFNRTITSIDYGFNFRTNNNTLKHDFIPFEAYYVKANLSDTFQKSLRALNDAFLANSFQDHITTLSKYTITYTSKENSNTSMRPVHYVRWTIQSSGNILRSLFNATNQPKDSIGRYHLFNIPFAQFVRSDIDYRLYVPIRKKSRLVYRVAGGIGRPLSNLKVLPYEQSFFSGGPNSVRAWRARTLGPGGYDPSSSSTRYDKIGDILLEGNVEYRFHIIRSFNGALFVDAGNIWRIEPDENKPGGEFKLKTFADQIAIGGGFGIRWDLTFFVLRLDLAMPLKDPKYAPGNRWTFNKQPWQNTVANFGIGYPF